MVEYGSAPEDDKDVQKEEEVDGPAVVAEDGRVAREGENHEHVEQENEHGHDQEEVPVVPERPLGVQHVEEEPARVCQRRGELRVLAPLIVLELRHQPLVRRCLVTWRACSSGPCHHEWI